LKILDGLDDIRYNIRLSEDFRFDSGKIRRQTRGCTGFDGGFEAVAAIRGPYRVNNRKLKLNAEDNLAYAA
jgi:hypothetical protein